MRILIGTNLLTNIDPEIYANHTALYYHLGIIAERRKWQFFTAMPTRTSIDRMRNEAGKNALNLECDRLIFIDDDMLLKTDTIEKLVDADKDIVMAHTYIRGYPFKPMSFKREDTEDPADIKLVFEDDVVSKADPETNLCEVAAIGFAAVCIKTDLLKELDPPWFITGPNGTEDIYFCLRCKQELNREVGIFTHIGVPTAHKLNNEYISEENVERFREFYKPKESNDENSRGDRGEEYHNQIKKLEVNIGENFVMGDNVG